MSGQGCSAKVITPGSPSGVSISAPTSILFAVIFCYPSILYVHPLGTGGYERCAAVCQKPIQLGIRLAPFVVIQTPKSQ